MKHAVPFESEKYGFHFRSWLERKWATFLYSLQREGGCFTWSYEPEGYLLPSGEGYRPDFSINRHDPLNGELFTAIPILIEVKPNRIEYLKDKARLDEFILTSPFPVLELLVVIGSPGSEEILWFINATDVASWEGLEEAANPPYVKYIKRSNNRFEKEVWMRSYFPSKAWGVWLRVFPNGFTGEFKPNIARAYGIAKGERRQ
jgi:hypothetical protein